jgi:guanidinoacetate N-methyltransferase
MREYPMTADAWSTMEVRVTDSELTIGGWQVMQTWEEPLMDVLASEVTTRGGDILEVGFGLGISAGQIIEKGCQSYTVIEAHPEIAENARKWGARQAVPVEVIEGTWQAVTPTLDRHFDGILFDTFPLTPEERGRNHFAFIPIAPRLLREGGMLVHYSDETVDFRMEHLRLLLESFNEVRLIRVDGLEPPPDCEYWSSSQMIIPVARNTPLHQAIQLPWAS